MKKLVPTSDSGKLKEIVQKIIDFNEIDFSKIEINKQNKKIKVSTKGVGLTKACKNPIIAQAITQPILSNVGKQIPEKEKEELWMCKKKIKNKKTKEKYEEKFRKVVTNTIANQLKNNLESADISSSIFPTSVALSETPNYYINEPKESYSFDVKLELLNKLVESICGRCGMNIYGFYVPEEGRVLKEILKKYIPDFWNIDITKIAGIGKIKPNEIGEFEFLFYLLDKSLQEMYGENKEFPDFHVELFLATGGRGRKILFSHHTIPNISDVFDKLYRGEEKYTKEGNSKIKELISSFLVERWKIPPDEIKNNSKIGHLYINRLLYSIFFHKKLDIDSVLSLEELKIKLNDTTPVGDLKEVMSMNEEKVEKIGKWAFGIARKLIEVGERDKLDRFLIDLRSANLPHEFANVIVNNMITFEKSGIFKEPVWIPPDLQYFSNVTEFKQAKAIVLANIHNAKQKKQEGGEI